MIDILRTHTKDMPFIRYCASYFGCDYQLRNEVWRLERGSIVVVAQLMLLGAGKIGS
jgi:hypothetical protein